MLLTDLGLFIMQLLLYMHIEVILIKCYNKKKYLISEVKYESNKEVGIAKTTGL